ncbi:cytochrome P450 [Nocardia sp. NBC_01009]|uniref:cytochrome P450 n=1 Tax=Nocardia sp. NBC_01009 TaxID=2975996 RepID=UPI003866D1EA|nr:cytochrome P450 [Nocardia sp. NBC_01009]
MSASQSNAQAATCPVPHLDSPVIPDSERVPLYAPEFATDPHGAYRALRDRYGSMVPVDIAPGVPATLVIGYRTAVRILHDPERFPADPRTWERDIPSDCPVLPVMGWRPNAQHSAGLEHHRYRQVNTASLDAVDRHAMHATVEQIAVPLIDSFCETGTADLISRYAFPLVFDCVNALLGCPPEIGRRIAAGISAVIESVDSTEGNVMLAEALMELVTLKREQPGDDVTSRVLQHPAALDDTEALHQLAALYGAGLEPLQNLIVKTMLLILVDERFAGDVLDGRLSTRDALDEVLFNDPPLANMCFSYPRQPILIDDVWLPAHQPVIISMAACNSDPAVNTGDRVGNRSHLAWSLGPHACPAQSVGYQIAEDAIDQLLDALPELELAIPADELVWRPGPFHRALTALPVTFPPASASTTL